jgi:hypothetical protein
LESIIAASQDTIEPDIRRFALPANAPSVWLFDTDKSLKAHPAYVKAKAGHWQSALTLVSELALAHIYSNRDKFSRDCIFVAPFAREASGDNAIPQVLAEVCAAVCGASADQTNKRSNYWKRGMQMSSSKSSAFKPTPSHPTKPATLSASARLTKSEIDSLRQNKRLISDFVQKEFQASLSAKLALLQK